MLDPTTLPRIPAEEYPQRWRRAQALVAEQGLDLLIAYADDRATYGAAHARWLADFPVHFEPACILLRREGNPILVCGPESDEYARLRGRIADVRVLREFTNPDEDYPYSTIQSLGEILGDVCGDAGRIRNVGVAGRGLMNADLVAALMATLPGAAWRNVEGQVCELRAVKSPAELAVIRHAYLPSSARAARPY